MKANFKLDQNIALEYESYYLDLHNNFDFCSFNFDIIERKLQLVWQCGTGDWIPETEYKKVTLTIDEVEYFTMFPRYNDAQISDDSCLMDITYYPSSERDENESVSSNSYPKDDDDIIFKFENGSIIRVHGKNIIASVE